ncbi:uncharacterized protein YndB with AHSA1/START domain [Spinactinospora alkalitolerans]|uniref:Uncharacterized protein YndB with AHSA1/START domain n=1 Tax=Spinactinospora alkalitolerans TaxID=687207 RepID=A0A852TTN1_9ACTN|nr:SRPBCC family protein [Spinactinospora alkalitolerans]NYE47379.1 uncharacterized protein YndB with AHSA1/START domain [Spinactinospora alkalitolerans]
MNETLRTVDGRPVLRIQRQLHHTPEKVWRAITEPDHLSRWYPFQVTDMDLRIGGRIDFDDGAGTTMTATITELDPPRTFAFSEHAPAQTPNESDDLVHFELRPEGADCLLVFTHTFDDRPAAAAYATGWQTCLDQLQALLADRPAPAATDPAQRHETYISAFGLDTGSTGSTEQGWLVRFDRQLMGPPIDTVWDALTSGAETATTGTPAPPTATTREVPAAAITALQAPTLLEYDWRDAQGPAGRVRWELSQGPAGARITLTQTGPHGAEQERSTALAAWRTHLDLLARRLHAPTPG